MSNPYLGERFLWLMHALESLGQLMKHVTDTAYYFNPAFYETQRELKKRGCSPDTWWEHDLVEVNMLPIISLTFGQAAFEGFLQEVIDTLTSPAPASADTDYLPGLRKLARQLKDQLGVAIDESDETTLFEFANTRNLWIHNNGIATERYAQGTKKNIKAGELRVVLEDEAHYALWFYDDLARKVLVQAVGPDWHVYPPPDAESGRLTTV
jgi:hypothetical protein